MCTIVCAHRVLADAAVAVAANRDEALDRPAEPPRARGSDPVVVAPRDREAGGTWIGSSAAGLVVALANRWTDGPAGDRSRGRLVADALAQPTLAAALRTVERDLDRRAFAPFSMLMADRQRAVLIEWTGRLRVRSLARGVHVVVNVGADGTYAASRDRPAASRRQMRVAETLRDALTARPTERASEWLDRASEWLADHHVGACVHGDGFGTRSSSLIALGSDATFRYADGPPCRTQFRDIAAPEGHL
ncbi:NRDE family protein [Halococcoides cellulosivorans]|uniref:NRDE family protein n=1 Tax=Halococcoides cellulosivorans TaxID=1679096 RepID=A0A2R4WZ39_9EURY|nr:NRDE family protein [Halococcoides cellulosivorans]AWB26808.1 hypothetical protein HARCEL1_03290 [Halococcoides cellulosivorans]